MNREETHALFAQGKDAWNDWANDMLAQKLELHRAGRWKVVRHPTGQILPGKTADWITAACAEFSTKHQPHTFKNRVEFTGLVFPGAAIFVEATFNEWAMFSGVTFCGDAVFSRASFKWTSTFVLATFEGDVRFYGTTFYGDAIFHESRFRADATFEEARFRVVAELGHTTFEKNARFYGAMFDERAHFDRARFCGEARFDRVIFSGNARFDRTKFKKTPSFVGATFKGITSFAKARFQGPALFTAILSERAFTLEDAKFQKVPDFIQANFSQALRLDNLEIEPGWMEGKTLSEKTKSCWKRLTNGDRNVPARWRALKRLAIQGHDLEREQQFFPMEIKSARFVTDWPLPFAQRNWSPPKGKTDDDRPWNASVPIVPWRAKAWTGFFRFWFGILYQGFSNFGRSILRPGLTFLAIALVSAAMYLGESQRHASAQSSPLMGRFVAAATHTFADSQTVRAAHPCATVSGQNLRSLEPEIAARTDALSEAMHLSWTNGSIVGGLGGLDSARRTYGCLYGFVEDGGKSLTPIMPPGVSIIATWQKLFSVILIFLFGLAIRNMLKMH